MYPHSRFTLICIYLFLAVGLLSWAGCEPTDDEDPPTACDFNNIRQLNYSDYCSPAFLAYTDLANPGEEISNLPDYCASNYNSSRTLQLEVPAGGIIYLHRYKDFPANVVLEFIGTDCDGNYTLLNSCTSDESASLVSTHEVDASGFSTLIVRAIYTANSEYEPGTRPNDELSFAAFTAPYTPAQILNADTDADRPILVDCNGRTNSFILSPSPGGVSPVQAAIELGLPYEECQCTEELVKVELPPGVSLNAVRPKVPRNKTMNDTTRFSFNNLINIPVTTFTNSDFGDPQLDPNVGGNPCLDFQFPFVPEGTNALRVTIVDSGADYLNAGDAFGPTQDLSPAVDCITHGPYGYNFLTGDGEPTDNVGHGTAVASAFLSGLNTQQPINLVNYKFLDDQAGTLFDAMCATYTAVYFRSDIVNLSWGFPSQEFPPVLEYVLDFALNENVLIVASAGNDSRNVSDAPNYWPAQASFFYPNILTVGSHYPNSPDVELVPFSNFSVDAVNIAAIYSTQTLSLGGGTDYPAGTSISAPIVARKLVRYASSGGGYASVINDFFSDSESVRSSSNLPEVEGGRYVPLPDPGMNCGPANGQ